MCLARSLGPATQPPRLPSAISYTQILILGALGEGHALNGVRKPTSSGASLHTMDRAAQAATSVVQMEVRYNCPTSLLRGIVTMLAWPSSTSCAMVNHHVDVKWEQLSVVLVADMTNVALSARQHAAYVCSHLMA